MRQIQFVHQCDVPSGAEGAKPRRVERQEIMAESDIDPKWLAGALREGFCRVVTAQPETAQPETAQPEAAPQE